MTNETMRNFVINGVKVPSFTKSSSNSSIKLSNRYFADDSDIDDIIDDSPYNNKNNNDMNSSGSNVNVKPIKPKINKKDYYEYEAEEVLVDEDASDVDEDNAIIVDHDEEEEEYDEEEDDEASDVDSDGHIKGLYPSDEEENNEGDENDFNGSSHRILDAKRRSKESEIDIAIAKSFGKPKGKKSDNLLFSILQARSDTPANKGKYVNDIDEHSYVNSDDDDDDDVDVDVDVHNEDENDDDDMDLNAILDACQKAEESSPHSSPNKNSKRNRLVISDSDSDSESQLQSSYERKESRDTTKGNDHRNINLTVQDIMDDLNSDYSNNIVNHETNNRTKTLGNSVDSLNPHLNVEDIMDGIEGGNFSPDVLDIDNIMDECCDYSSEEPKSHENDVNGDDSNDGSLNDHPDIDLQDLDYELVITDSDKKKTQDIYSSCVFKKTSIMNAMDMLNKKFKASSPELEMFMFSILSANPYHVLSDIQKANHVKMALLTSYSLWQFFMFIQLHKETSLHKQFTLTDDHIWMHKVLNIFRKTAPWLELHEKFLKTRGIYKIIPQNAIMALENEPHENVNNSQKFVLKINTEVPAKRRTRTSKSLFEGKNIDEIKSIKERLRELMKMIVMADNIQTIEIPESTSSKLNFSGKKVMCPISQTILTNKTPISVHILFFKRSKPFSFLTRRVPTVPSESIFVVAIREYLQSLILDHNRELKNKTANKENNVAENGINGSSELPVGGKDHPSKIRKISEVIQLRERINTNSKMIAITPSDYNSKENMEPNTILMVYKNTQAGTIAIDTTTILFDEIRKSLFKITYGVDSSIPAKLLMTECDRLKKILINLTANKSEVDIHSILLKYCEDDTELLVKFCKIVVALIRPLSALTAEYKIEADLKHKLFNIILIEDTIFTIQINTVVSMIIQYATKTLKQLENTEDVVVELMKHAQLTQWLKDNSNLLNRIIVLFRMR
jgi:hypothetical protein